MKEAKKMEKKKLNSDEVITISYNIVCILYLHLRIQFINLSLRWISHEYTISRVTLMPETFTHLRLAALPKMFFFFAVKFDWWNIQVSEVYISHFKIQVYDHPNYRWESKNSYCVPETHYPCII